MIRLGYHPATYLQHGVDPDAAVRDISRAGWNGFEWSPTQLTTAYDSPRQYQEYLRDLGIVISGVYCSCSFGQEQEVQQWKTTIHGTLDFCLAVGCQYIIFDGGSTELERNPHTINRIADCANQMGQRVVDAGLTCTWHQHWGTIFEYPPEFDALMAATDPSIVKFTPDTAQLALGDFDIPATFEQYIDRMHYVHFKDLDHDRRFIELGRGTIDFRPLAAMLQQSGFDGWVVTDLDYTSLDPHESSRHNLHYLRDVLGFASADA